MHVPTSPNPTLGFTVIVHKSKAVNSQLDIEAVSSFIISAGVDFAKPEEVAVLPHNPVQ